MKTITISGTYPQEFIDNVVPFINGISKEENETNEQFILRHFTSVIEREVQTLKKIYISSQVRAVEEQLDSQIAPMSDNKIIGNIE